MPPFLEDFLQRVPWLSVPVRFGWRFNERWNNNACALMAAAMAFFGLLSVFPLTLAGVAILARFLANDPGALKDFAHFVSAFFPGAAGAGIAQEIERSVRAIAGGPSATTLGAVAVASLLWSGRAYFDTLATVLNRIFPDAEQRTFVGHQITLWALILGVGALFLLSTASTFALSVVQSLAARLPDLFINRAPYLWDFLGKLAGWTLTFAMFYLLYRFAPNRTKPFKRRIVTISALLAAVAWEVSKVAFTRFLGNVTRYEATYGSVAGVIVTMMWIYISSTIVLAGAEIGATVQEMKNDMNEKNQVKPEKTEETPKENQA
jgi:membrane protein